ncbi:hypothetical protein ACV566_16225 [Staphylococcus aureus]
MLSHLKVALAMHRCQCLGACAVYLNIFHYDVVEFLDTKKVNADEDLTFIYNINWFNRSI